MRNRLIGIGLVIAALGAVLYAQEPQRFERGIQLVRGNLGVGSGSIVFEGATGDASETTLSVEDPTADRTWTIPNTASDTFLGIGATQVMTAAGATETLTSADCGQTTLLDTAAGSVVTLPAATGTGCRLTFLVTVTLTSNTHDIVLGSAADDMVGALTVVSTTIANSDTFFIVDGSDNDTIQMDGNTEGGEAGSVIYMQDIAAGQWFVQGVLVGVGATPTTAFLTGQVS